ncbi:MAG: hypothetical protein AAFZ65_07240 [Planctomycetota bacterium]
MLTQRVPCAAAAAALLLSPTPLLAQQVADGWRTDLLIDPAGSQIELSDGSFVTFDGQFVARVDATGVNATTLFDFGAFVFGGALVAAPDESFVVVGESSNGELYRVALDGSGGTFLADLDFNFDAAFAPDGALYVSAAVGGFGAGNDLLRVDVATGATTTVAQVAGPSGPIDFDSNGSLFYATQSGAFPAPAGSTDVLAWSDAQLNGGLLLSEADATLVEAGFDGGGSLVIDRVTDAIYLAENNFGSGLNQIRRVGAGSPVLFAGEPFEFLTLEGYVAGSGPQVFAPFQPEGAGRLTIGRSDFATINQRLALTPQRPTLTSDGPGATGPGAVYLNIAGAAPLEGCLLYFAPGGTTESLVVPNLVPLFVEIDLGPATPFPFALATGADGGASVSLFNPGGASLSMQGLLIGFEGGMMTALGTTTAVSF